VLFCRGGAIHADPRVEKQWGGVDEHFVSGGVDRVH